MNGRKWVCLILVVVMLVGVLTGCFAHDEIIVVEKKSWRYNMRIEKNVLCFENDWTMPDGAILIRTEREKYEEKYDEEGNFEGWEYRTRYYYQIWRWKYERDVITSGENDTPYYGEPDLKYNEKIASRTQGYYIHGKNQEGEFDEYSLDFDEWNSIGIGDTVSAEVSLFNTISEIYEIRKPLEALE